MTQDTHDTAIDFAPLLASLEQPLQLVTDPEARARTQAYIDAARPQIERAVFDVLSDTIAALNQANTVQRASLEYAHGGLNLRIEDVQEMEPEQSYNDDDPERVTIRLPKELKALIDLSAARQGVSANNWYVRALSRAIAHQLRHERHAEHFAQGRQRDPGENDTGRGRRRRGFYRGRGGRAGAPPSEPRD